MVGIGRSIKEGFRAANKSWAGMGFFAGVWIVLILIGVAGVVVTNPPEALFRREEPAATSPTPAPAATQAAPTAPATEAATAAVPGGADAESARKREEENRAVGVWFGRAWPVVLFCAVLFLAVGTWLSGGQIGYLAKRLLTGQAGLSEFWIVGARAFWPLLGATILGFLIIGGIALGVILIVAWLGSVLSTTLPVWLLRVLGLLTGAAALIGLIWLVVRLSCWPIAIVQDRVGPIAGLKASARATRGHMWFVIGLGLLLWLISVGVWLPFGVVEFLGGSLGGAAAAAMSLIGRLLGGVANLYAGFVSLAAFIRFYEDAKAPAAASTTPAASSQQ